METPEVPHQPSMPPTTTYQEELTTTGQRRVNLIWEFTQSAIALIVILANMITGVIFAVSKEHAAEFPPVLMNSLFLVIGFYFSRTNHAAVGGVGAKPEQPYIGR